MTISIVECGLKNVTCSVERNVLHNIITCNNLIGAALLTAAEQIAYRHDTRPFLRVKGRACQTSTDRQGQEQLDNSLGDVHVQDMTNHLENVEIT